MIKKVIGLIIWLAISFSAAWFGSQFTINNIENWYSGIIKPSWTPPDYLFGPVWSFLYATMAVAAWLVWEKNGFKRARIALLLFMVQLLLNALWSYIFFGAHLIGLALIDIFLLFIAILATLLAFKRHSRVAAVLLIPYLAWVGFASILNYSIWRLN